MPPSISYIVSGSLRWVSLIDSNIARADAAKPNEQALSKLSPSVTNISWPLDFDFDVSVDETLKPGSGSATLAAGEPDGCKMLGQSVTQPQQGKLHVHTDTQYTVRLGSKAGPLVAIRSATDYLRAHGCNYNWVATVERRSEGAPQTLNQSLPLQNPWKIHYDGPKSPGGFLAFDVNLTPAGGGQTISLFHRANGQDQSSVPPFSAVVPNNPDGELLIIHDRL